MSNIQALSVDIKEVGKKIKSSKKRFTWFFSINGKKHTVDLFVSKLSGKKKLILNGRSIHEEKNLMAGFCQRFEIDGNSINVQTKGDSFEMVFNKTQTFSELYTQAKTRSEFQEEEGHFDSYDQDFSKGKAMQSKYQGFSSSTYHPPSKNSQEMKNFSNNNNKNQRDNNNFNNNNARNSDGGDSDDEPSSGGHSKADNLRINQGNQNKVDSKKPTSKDPYAFDSGFDKYDWKGNGNNNNNNNNPQSQKPKQSDQAFDNFNNQFANPQRSQQQQVPPVVQPKQKVPPTTDFSQFTFGAQPNKPLSQPQSQQPSQASSQQAKNTFDAFGAPNTSQAVNGGQKSADPFSDFFKQGNENIFANTGSSQNNKPASNPSNAFNNFGQQPAQDSFQQQKAPSQQQQIVQQQPPVQQPVKQTQQVNVFDLLGDDEPHVPPQPVQQPQIQPQAVQQPAFQAQLAQQQVPAANNNLTNLMNNLSINPAQNQPNVQTQQPVQPQATDLLNMYQQTQQTQQVPQQQQKPLGSNYAALYAVSNPFESAQQQPVLSQYNGSYNAPQQGYGLPQQQYNPYAQQQQYQQAPQQQQYLQGQQQFSQVQQQQSYQQQQFQPQQAQQMGGYPTQNAYGYNNNIGVQGAVQTQFQPQVVQQAGSSATPFDDLF